MGAASGTAECVAACDSAPASGTFTMALTVTKAHSPSPCRFAPRPHAGRNGASSRSRRAPGGPPRTRRTCSAAHVHDAEKAIAYQIVPNSPVFTSGFHGVLLDETPALPYVNRWNAITPRERTTTTLGVEGDGGVYHFYVNNR